MKRWLMLGAVLSTLLAVGQAADADKPASGGIGRVEALSRALRTQAVWRADYSQVYLAPGMTIGDRAAGQVWIAWPDRTRFDSTSGVAQRTGLEGRRLRLVDPLTPSCEEHQLSDEELARIPLSVLLDPHQAVDRFAVDVLGEHGFVLLPREPGGVSRVEVQVGAEGLPTEVVVVDAQDARNRLQFVGWVPSEPPVGGWLPATPEGVVCATESGGEPR